MNHFFFWQFKMECNLRVVFWVVFWCNEKKNLGLWNKWTAILWWSTFWNQNEKKSIHWEDNLTFFFFVIPIFQMQKNLTYLIQNLVEWRSYIDPIWVYLNNSLIIILIFLTNMCVWIYFIFLIYNYKVGKIENSFENSFFRLFFFFF